MKPLMSIKLNPHRKRVQVTQKTLPNWSRLQQNITILSMGTCCQFAESKNAMTKKQMFSVRQDDKVKTVISGIPNHPLNIT